MHLGHGRPDQPQHGCEVVAVQAGGGEFDGGGRADGVVDARFAYRISPSAALTGVLVMLVFLFPVISIPLGQRRTRAPLA